MSFPRRGDPSKGWVPRESPEISLSAAGWGLAKAEQVAWKCTRAVSEGVRVHPPIFPLPGVGFGHFREARLILH